MRFTPFALSAVCLVTNVANPLAELTRAQVQDLVARRATTWDQVSGSPRSDAIHSAGGELGTGFRSVFLAIFVDAATVFVEADRTFATAPQTRDYIRADDAAWGYVDLAYATGLHVVPFDGVGCTRKTVGDGSYPGRRELSFVTRARPGRAAARFIRWVRTSPVARRVIATRYVPVR